MKTIIIYYSYSGNNDALAKELRSRFGCELVKIQEKKRRTGLTIMLDLFFKRETKIQNLDISLKDYKTVIFIAPIWDAKIATPLCTYLKRERENIKDYSFITVCGGRGGQKEKITNQLYDLTGKMPMVVAELPVNDLLPVEKKNQIKYVTAYRLRDEDIHAFKKGIQDFVSAVMRSSGGFVERKATLEST